jgi:hypothetical protein
LYYPVFYLITGAVQGLTLDQTIARAKDTFIPLMKRNLIFWIPVQFGTFGYIEENLQIPVLIVCGLVWTVILSLSAGSVGSSESSSTNVDDELDTATLMETTMKELDVAEGALSINGTSYFFGSNDDEVSIHSTTTTTSSSTNYNDYIDTEEEEELNSIWIAQNVDTLRPCGLLEEQDACT